ncbi:MAG: hypothetical protein ACN6PN_11070, partial [Sphingobacterium sp.]
MVFKSGNDGIIAEAAAPHPPFFTFGGTFETASFFTSAITAEVWGLETVDCGVDTGVGFDTTGAGVALCTVFPEDTAAEGVSLVCETTGSGSFFFYSFSS